MDYTNVPLPVWLLLFFNKSTTRHNGGARGAKIIFGPFPDERVIKDTGDNCIVTHTINAPAPGVWFGWVGRVGHAAQGNYAALPHALTCTAVERREKKQYETYANQRNSAGRVACGAS